MKSDKKDIELRATKAQQILDEPLLVDAFEAIEEEVMGKILALGPTDDEERYRGIVSLQVVKSVKQLLKNHIETGKLGNLHNNRN